MAHGCPSANGCATRTMRRGCSPTGASANPMPWNSGGQNPWGSPGGSSGGGGGNRPPPGGPWGGGGGDDDRGGGRNHRPGGPGGPCGGGPFGGGPPMPDFDRLIGQMQAFVRGILGGGGRFTG